MVFQGVEAGCSAKIGVAGSTEWAAGLADPLKAGPAAWADLSGARCVNSVKKATSRMPRTRSHGT